MAVLVIGSWSSACGKCNGSADPYDDGHNTMLGYGDSNGRPGCGEKWTAVTSAYGDKGAIDATKRMRPDLPYVGYWESFE